MRVKLPNIGKDVWDARPLLTEIRARAHARAVGADPVLWNVLTAVASAIPAHVAYETGMLAPVRPTLIHVPVSASGIGKTSSVSVALSLVPGLPPRHPLSTGQGLVQAYYGSVLVPQPQLPDKDGKERPPRHVRVMRRVRHNVLCVMGEGEVLFKEMAKAGSTVSGTLRQWWTGEQCGQGNATEGLYRVLDDQTYTGGLIVCTQADIVGPLIGDTATGTAQRVVWSSALDSTVPYDRPTAPLGPLTWSPPLPRMPVADPTQGFLSQAASDVQGEAPPLPPPVLMPVASSIVDRLWRERVDRLHAEVEAESEVSEHDSQRPAMLIKISGVLAWMDGRLSIGVEDWQLAGELLSASDAVRDALLNHAERLRFEALRTRGVERAQVDRAAAAAEGVRERCKQRVLELLGGAKESVPERELPPRLSTPQRAHLTEVLASLADDGSVIRVEGPQGGAAFALAPKAEEA